jgi:type IV secretion system protein VirD4
MGGSNARASGGARGTMDGLAGTEALPTMEPVPLVVGFRAQAPAVFTRAGAVAALGGVAAGLVAVGGAAWRASRKDQSDTYGSAHWADDTDVAKAGLHNGRGAVLGLYLRHDGPEHVLVVAPTRSSKGVGLVVPTLLTWPRSTVVHDIKGENWVLTAAWRAQFSHCRMFDPTNPQSSRFNPLLEVRDVQNIADILVDPEGVRERRDHWEKAAQAPFCTSSTPRRKKHSRESPRFSRIRRAPSCARSGSC